MDVAAIVVNYRTAEATVEAVAVLLREMEGLQDPHVIVVDNDSGDGSLQKLEQAFAGPAWPNRVTVIGSGHNGGYGFGINVGVRRLLAWPNPPRYVHVINPDAIPDAGSVKRLVAFMDGHPDAGMAGSYVYNPVGEDRIKGFRFPSLLGEFESTAKTNVVARLLRNHAMALFPDQSCEVDWVSGSNMVIRREVFQQSALFDEGYFLYFEEVDFARQVRNAGWKIYYVDGASVGHLGSVSTGMADETRRMPGYWFQARRRYFVKHHGAAYTAACDAAWVCGYAMCVAKTKLLRRKVVFRPHLWRDFIRYSAKNLLKPPPDAEQNRAVRGVAASGTAE
ncbi:MAG: glycosyltransferase family 2 protein [Myxococcales bacterium]